MLNHLFLNEKKHFYLFLKLTEDIYKEKRKMTLRQDVWTHDSCLVCQSMHSAEEDKNKHELEASHKKKVVVYDFLSRELSCLTPSNQKSFLYERYYRANVCIAGLDCICELNFSWSTVPLWACTICYVAGETLESADDHMHSSYHKRNYICEYHPDRYANMLKVQEKSAKNKQSLLEQEAIVDILLEAKGLLAPDVYVLNGRSQEWAFQKLGLTSEPRKDSFTVEEVTDNHKIALCYVCGETFISFAKEEEFREAWFAHLSTSIHQRCKAMQILVHEDSLVECEGVPEECELRTNSEFQRLDDSPGDDDANYGPTVGLDFLIVYNGTDCFCSLCFAIIPKASVTNHFSSEYHIERFFRRDDPGKLLNTQHLSVSERHGILEFCYEERKLTSHKYYRSTAQIPLLLQKYALQQRNALVKDNLKEVDLGRNIKAVWCEECKEYVNTAGDENAWSIHIFDEAHFERAAKKALYHYDKTVATRSCSVLDHFTHSFPPRWEEQFSVTLGVMSIQDRCEFGLEFIVRDALSAKLYCTCCFVQCDDNDTQMFSKHARSLDHITRAMHSLNKKTLITLNWRFPNVNDRKPLIMDYLVHCRSNLRQQNGVSVYNPALVYKLNCSMFLPKRLFELAKITPNDRIDFITTHKKEGTPEMIPLNIALNEHCQIEVKLEKNEVIVCHCEECSQSFSEKFDKLDTAIEEHLLSLSHWERAKTFSDNPFDESQRIHEKESKIKVPPYKQPDPKKKVTWKWNDKKSCYEFVYAQLGLEDIRERRNFEEGKVDFFCTLCAQSFKVAKLDLECHIRSFSHLFYFMHKHRPAIIPELQAQITAELEVTEKQKNMRRFFARTLKGFETEKKHCGIPIYDFEERECEYADVKKALEEDKMRESDKHSKRDAPAYEIFDLNVLNNRIQNQKWPNSEALDKHLTMITEICMGTENNNRTGAIICSLEQAKKQLLYVAHFDGRVQLEDGAAAANAPTANVANGVEKRQTEQAKEPVEKTKKRNTPSESTESNPSIPTSTSVYIPRESSKQRESERSRRTRTPPPHRRSRHRSRSPFQQRRSSRHRVPEYRRSRDSKSPSPKRTRKERMSNDSSTRPSNRRSKSVNRRPMSRTSTSPIPYESAKKRLEELKTKFTTDPPRQFFPLLPTQNQKEFGSHPAPVPLTPPAPVPPAVPNYMKKKVGGVYDAGFLEEAYPDLLRKSQPAQPSGAQARAHEEPRVATASTELVEIAVSAESLNENDDDANKTNTPEDMRNQLMNRLKNGSKKDFKKNSMNVPKDLPAFKQQALMRQQTEKRKSKSPTKKFGGTKGANTVDLQERQIENRQEEERLQAISPEPDDIVEVIEHQTQQSVKDPKQLQQQQQRNERQEQQPNKTMNELSKSRWDWASGKFVPIDSPVAQSYNTQSLSDVPSSSTTSYSLGMSTTPKLGDPTHQAQHVLSQIAMSTSAVTAQQLFSGQQQPSMANVNSPVVQHEPMMGMFRPNMPIVNSTNLLGHQPLPSLAPFGTAPPPVPPNLIGTINSALGVPMSIPPPRFNQQMPPMMGSGFPPPMPPMPNPAEMIVYSKMQLYSRDLATIDTIATLIEYMWKQGYEPISPGDPPLLFNEVLNKRKGLIGANTLYQIICFGHPELETYYCGMCNHWTTVSEMFNHLRASMHRLSYMFRNYKMYHRKAMEELDEERRDFMLERFASKIWEIEGCGRCSNRMRCILNEEAIRRIWPDYISCVDNSWKIDDDDDEFTTLQQCAPPQKGFLPPLPQQSPTMGAEQLTMSATPTAFSDHTMVRATAAQVRASIVAKKLELAERSGQHGLGLVSLNSDNRPLEQIEQNAINLKEKRGSEKESDVYKDSSSSRSEKRRDRSKERSKQSSSRSKRSRSKERERKKGERDRERERDAKRRSRSREKVTKTDSGTEKDSRSREEGNESWVEKAAQFLHKIGDTENATKLYWSAAEEADAEPIEADQDKMPETDKASGSQSTIGIQSADRAFSLAERLASSSSQSMLRRRNQIDDQEQQQVRGHFSPEKPTSTETGRTERQRQLQKRLVVVDDKSEMRRAIAVMVELQQEYENNNGYLSAEMFFSTCQEFNIMPDQVLNNRLLCETANELHVDLCAGLQAFVQQRNQPQQCCPAQLASGSHFNLQSMGVDPSKLRGLDPRALQSILSKANVSNPQLVSSSTSAHSAPSPMRSRFEVHDISLDESMTPGNYVYPSYDEGVGHAQKQRRCPVDIDSNISRLTYAFGQSQDGPTSSSGATGRVVPEAQQTPQRQRHPFAAVEQPKLRGEQAALNPAHLLHHSYQPNQPQTPQQQQQTKNPDLRRIAEEVGDDWNSLESFSFEMLGLSSAAGGPPMEAQPRQNSTPSASVHPPPNPPKS